MYWHYKKKACDKITIIFWIHMFWRLGPVLINVQFILCLHIYSPFIQSFNHFIVIWLGVFAYEYVCTRVTIFVLFIYLLLLLMMILNKKIRSTYTTIIYTSIINNINTCVISLSIKKKEIFCWYWSDRHGRNNSFIYC